MSVLAGVTLRDRAAFVDGVLVLADLHLGQGERSTVELPVGDGSEMIERLETLCEHFDPSTVLIAGDLLHSFRTVPRTVQRTVDSLQQVVEESGAELVVIPGNHDTMLDSVWDGETTDSYRVGDTVVCHGHVQPEADAQRYILGHDHPSIAVEGRKRSCYLAGESVYRDAALLMLPPFSRLVPGAQINGMGTDDFLSPLVTDADALRPVVLDESAEETLEFPPLGEFRHRL